MKKLSGYLLLLFCLILNTSLNHALSRPFQNKKENAAGGISYPQGYFKPPLNIPLTLAGNFGEPRSSHFHTGIDIRTNEHEGYKVYASAAGYISRINVSPTGYGNALYITHPNGYVTVYGHLKEFNARLMQRLRKEQYAKKMFAVDINLTADEFPVKQGELIALSGNTGSSGGPHLHFEIRDSEEHPINPMLFGMPVKDTLPPVVKALKFYPMDELKFNCDGERTKVYKSNGLYQVTGGEVKLNAARVGISVNTYDVMNDTKNKVGIYEMKMYDNGTLKYEYKMDRIAFTDARYVISQIDYPLFIDESNAQFNKCFVEPGNHCPVYHHLDDRGIIDISDGQIHHIKIEVSDFAANTSTIQFNMLFDKNSTLFRKKETPYLAVFNYNEPNEFSRPGIKIKIPAGCLFDTVYFNYSSLPASDTIFSEIYEAGSSSVWTFGWFDISLKTENLDGRQADKAVIVYKDDNGTEISCGGKSDNGYITSRVRQFGVYYVKIDTTPPIIVPLNLIEGKNMDDIGKLYFKISDNLSGVESFDTYLDGKWVLTDYDAKSSTLTYSLNPKLAVGEHSFKVVVSDERKNMAEVSIKFKL